MNRFAFAALFVLPLGCAMSTDTTDDQADELSRIYSEPKVSDVHFQGGCGVVTNPPQQDCSYGFALDFTKSYIDLKSSVSHTTNNNTRTVTITLKTWSTSNVHSHVMPQEQTEDLGLLDAKVGENYTVKVVDQANKTLWSGKVATLYHL
jgi:hypothetical protein